MSLNTPFGTEFKTNIKTKGCQRVVLKLAKMCLCLLGQVQRKISLFTQHNLCFNEEGIMKRAVRGLTKSTHLPFKHFVCPSPFSIHSLLQFASLAAISIGTTFAKAACNLPSPLEGLWMWSRMPRT